MKMRAGVIAAVGLAACVLVVSAADKKAPAASKKGGATVVEPVRAEFKEVMHGVKKSTLWGDPAKGPYGAYTKFDPGLANPLHTHSSEIHILVLRGAYVYKPQGGKEQRVFAGSFITIPAGDVHESAGDAREGALFYEESTGAFDLKPVEQKAAEPKKK
jgi:quercetin dioxygenase-like cupin family protein